MDQSPVESFSAWGPLAAFGASFTWAIGVLAYSKLSERYPAYIVNFYRILVGLPFFLIAVVFFRGNFEEQWQSLGTEQINWALLAVFSSYAFGDSLFLMASKRMGGPGALAIASVYPLWSALGGVLFRGEALSVVQIVGILIVITGSMTVILSDRRSQALIPPTPRLQDIPKKRRFLPNTSGMGFGVFLALMTSFFWASNSVAIAKVGVSLDAFFVNALRLGMAFFLCPLVGLLMHGLKSFRLFERRELLKNLPVIAVESIGGPFLYVYGLSHSSLAVGAVLTSVAPAISVPMALLLGREIFNGRKILGVIGVVAGVWLLLLG